MTMLESPIVGLTFRVRELGRLRMGQKVPMANGRTRPAKLDTFRLTSTDWRLIARAAELYGGEPETWADAPGWNKDKQTGNRQFQVVIDRDAIPVKIPGDLNWSQAMEAWTAAKCIRRCNGDAMDTGEPCQCREEMEEGKPAVCKPYSRVNLILPELPGWGFWRLETHGWEAAREFIPMVVMAARFGPDETYRLRIDPRTKKGEDEHGKPVTYQFGVPVLDTDRTPAELFATQADRLAIEAGQPALQAPDPAPPAPQRATGSGTTSEAGVVAADQDPRPASDLNASVTGPGDTGVSTGQEPPNAEAPTSPVSPGGGKAGRGRTGRRGSGNALAAATPPPAAPDEDAEQAAFEQALADTGRFAK